MSDSGGVWLTHLALTHPSLSISFLFTCNSSLTPPGNRLPVRRTPSAAVTGTRPGHHGRTRVAVFLQGGPVLRGDSGVHLLPSSGARLLVSKSPGNRRFHLWTAGGSGWPGGGHPAPYLRYQHQPANGGKWWTVCKWYNLTRSNGEFTVECQYNLFDTLSLDFFFLAVDSWISGYKNIDNSRARNSGDVRRRLSLSDCGLQPTYLKYNVMQCAG